MFTLSTMLASVEASKLLVLDVSSVKSLFGIPLVANLPFVLLASLARLVAYLPFLVVVRLYVRGFTFHIV